MQNKKQFISLGLLVLFVGAAAFFVGRIFNRRVNPVVEGGLLPGSQRFTNSSSNKIIPAPELPTTSPEVRGLYVELKDNTVIIQIISLDVGFGGTIGDSTVDVNSAPKAEIIITSKTIIYRDTTQASEISTSNNSTLQQTVEESTLDSLSPPVMVSVWGNRSGNRIIARIMSFSNSLAIQKP